MKQPTLYLMLGYPGAGKTTTAEVIANLTGATHLASDRIRLQMFQKPTFSAEEHATLYHEIDRMTEELLTQGKDVIYDANLNRYQHRKEKYDICNRTGATPVLVWVQADKNLAKSRASHFNRFQLWPKHETPDQMFDRIADLIEEPKPTEPYKVVDGTKVTEEYIKDLLAL